MNTHCEHTHHEHTPGAVSSHLCCSAQGAVGGSVPCSVVVLRVRECCTFIPPPHRQFLPAQDSNSQPLGYKSDSLTIRPRLPLFSCEILMQIKMLFIPVMAKLNFQQPLLHFQCHMMILLENILTCFFFVLVYLFL